jgi:hypothetical protein
MRTSINGFKWIEILLLHFRGPRADNKHDDCSPSSFFFYHHFRTPGLNSANKSSHHNSVGNGRNAVSTDAAASLWQQGRPSA